jgi:ectoine hydroxylase-related dioxygenase (phytanoyl-CoA dioxygenase family)
VSTVERELDEKGYAVLDGAIEASCLDAVRRECDALVDALADSLVAEGKVASTFSEEPFETRLIRLYEGLPDENPTIFRAELHREGFFGLFAHPRLLDIAESVLGSEIRLYPNYSVRPKLPFNRRTEVLWHQDAGYTSPDADGLRMINVWVPLVPATVENGCMEFIPCSHRLGVVPHERDEYYLRISDDALRPVERNAIPMEVNPGDAVLFSNLLFHRGLPNRSDRVRWSCDFRYQDATQPTMRPTEGHLLRSRLHPNRTVGTAAEWASRHFR